MIPFATSEYFAHALCLKPEEELHRARMSEWLPQHIIDCHAHSGLEQHVLSVSTAALGHMLSTFPYFSIDESVRLRALFFPKKNVRSLRFAKTFRGIDHRAANDYLLLNSPPEDRVAVFGLPEDIGYTCKLLRHPRTSALKMYWSYVDPPAQKIYDFFPREVLEEAQSVGVPIILHLPRMIVHSLDDLLRLVADFPRLRISIAHLGLSKMVVAGLAEAYAKIARYENVVMDTSLNPSSDVVELALCSLGRNRVLFGSDEPLNLIRSVAFLHPEKGQRIATDYRYHWVDPAEYASYGHLAAKATHAHWQCLQAIRVAVARFPKGTQTMLKERVFCSNASDFFGF
ncbi:MAG: amidohydrolase family protein [Candidatus Paceibacterota bacterium]|jgi:hypothetical protein